MISLSPLDYIPEETLRLDINSDDESVSESSSNDDNKVDKTQIQGMYATFDRNDANGLKIII